MGASETHEILKREKKANEVLVNKTQSNHLLDDDDVSCLMVQGPVGAKEHQVMAHFMSNGVINDE